MNDTTDTPDQPEKPKRLHQDPTNLRRVLDISADGTLTLLAGVINNHEQGISVGLVLTAGGSIIQGHLIPHREWWELQVERAARGGESAEVVIGALRTAMTEPPEGEDEDDQPPPQHLHLRDVTVFVGSAVAKTPLLKVRLNQVTSWALEGDIQSF